MVELEHINYVRRCKKKTDSERYKTMHAADNNATFCGRELNEMWFIESSAGRSPADYNCTSRAGRLASGALRG